MQRYILLTEKEVSDWLGMPEATLKTQRVRPPRSHEPIPFVKLPNGKIRYREDQVQRWIERNTSMDVEETRLSQKGPFARKVG